MSEQWSPTQTSFLYDLKFCHFFKWIIFTRQEWSMTATFSVWVHRICNHFWIGILALGFCWYVTLLLFFNRNTSFGVLLVCYIIVIFIFLLVCTSSCSGVNYFTFFTMMLQYLSSLSQWPACAYLTSGGLFVQFCSLFFSDHGPHK